MNIKDLDKIQQGSFVTPEDLERHELELKEMADKVREEQELEEQKKEFRKMLGLDKKPFVKSFKIPGRNETCPCGSGKKYKKCCMEEDSKILKKIYDKRR